MKRTTILADDSLLLEAKYLAEQQGKTLGAVVQEALREYVRRYQTPRRLSLAGVGRSGQPLTAQNEERVLVSAIDPIEGWSPHRKVQPQ